MMMKSDYWKNRFEELEAVQHYNATKVFEPLQKSLYKSQKEIKDKIELWLNRIADNNKVSLVEAKRMLNNKELKEFKWDVNEYIKRGHNSEKYVKELENASARYHISRLEALNTHIQEQWERYFDKEYTDVSSLLKTQYSNSYYHTCFELEKGLGIGSDIGKIDENKLSKIIAKPWKSDGKNFSDRIWINKKAMVDNLHQELMRTVALGKSSKEAIEHMTQFVDKQSSNAMASAKRLVYTESAYISSEAQKDAFKELNVEKYEIVATLDNRTSDICQSMDGQVFDMKDYEAGATAPPFHPNCRTTTAPFFNDEWTIGEERAARNENGKTYKVTSDMTYKEWKEKFIQPRLDEELAKKNKEKELEKLAEEKLIKAKIDAIMNEIKDNYSLDLNIGRQNKHILGTNENKNINGTLKSILTEDPLELIELYATNSDPVFDKNGKWNEKCRFTHNANIGYIIDKNNNKIYTKNGMMIFSKGKGIHLYPRK